MERHVLLAHFPLDLYHMEIFQHHGIRICVPHRGVLRPRRDLPLQFRKRVTALSYVGFVVSYQPMLTCVTQYTVSPHQVVVPNDYDVYHGATDIEKVEFPSDDKLVPTYSAAFRNGRDDTLPSKWFATRGPRFFTRFARPFETITRPQTAHTLTRKVSDGSLHGHLLARSDSLSSFGSKEGYYSDSKHSRTGGQQKRWLIE